MASLKLALSLKVVVAAVRKVLVAQVFQGVSQANAALQGSKTAQGWRFWVGNRFQSIFQAATSGAKPPYFAVFESTPNLPAMYLTHIKCQRVACRHIEATLI